jgi:hypothetical protein
MMNKNQDYLISVTTAYLTKIGKRKYSYLVIIHQKCYFVKYHSDSIQKYSEVN